MSPTKHDELGLTPSLQPGDVKLNLWIEYEAEDVSITTWYFIALLNCCPQGSSYRAPAFESIVKVVEPEGSWFDFKLFVITHSLNSYN